MSGGTLILIFAVALGLIFIFFGKRMKNITLPIGLAILISYVALSLASIQVHDYVFEKYGDLQTEKYELLDFDCKTTANMVLLSKDGETEKVRYSTAVIDDETYVLYKKYSLGLFYAEGYELHVRK